MAPTPGTGHARRVSSYTVKRVMTYGTSGLVSGLSSFLFVFIMGCFSIAGRTLFVIVLNFFSTLPAFALCQRTIVKYPDA